jgi:ornithine lipid ester-linked acyl 2-hydroxylase
VASSQASVRERISEGIINVGFRLILLLEKLIARYSLVGTTPFLSPERFSWIPTMEADWKKIRAELDEVMTYRDDLPNFQDISTDQASLTDDDRWKTYFFFGYGFKSDRNCGRCPATTAALESIPGMTTAFFSILSPHKEIGEHRGPYKGVLRYHLALQVPEPEDASGIKVGGEVGHWREGRSLVFDDTYQHEAWNHTDGYRTVLFVDFVRPLPWPVAALNWMVIKGIALSPYIKDSKDNHLDWEHRFEERRKAAG